MGAIGILALAANVASVLIIMRYKDGDANVRLCSRNDVIGNVARPVGRSDYGGAVLTSSIQILRQSFREMRETRVVPAE